MPGFVMLMCTMRLIPARRAARNRARELATAKSWCAPSRAKRAQ